MDSVISLSGSRRTSSHKSSIKEFHQFVILIVTTPLEMEELIYIYYI